MKLIMSLLITFASNSAMATQYPWAICQLQGNPKIDQLVVSYDPSPSIDIIIHADLMKKDGTKDQSSVQVSGDNFRAMHRASHYYFVFKFSGSNTVNGVHSRASILSLKKTRVKNTVHAHFAYEGDVYEMTCPSTAF